MATFVCHQCGVTFVRKHNLYRPNKFCSMQCLGKSQRKPRPPMSNVVEEEARRPPHIRAPIRRCRHYGDGRCVTCGEECHTIANEATDHLGLCQECYDLFKVSGMIPFLPVPLRRSHEAWVDEQTDRLYCRRIGNRTKERSA